MTSCTHTQGQIRFPDEISQRIRHSPYRHIQALEQHIRQCPQSLQVPNIQRSRIALGLQYLVRISISRSSRWQARGFLFFIQESQVDFARVRAEIEKGLIRDHLGDTGRHGGLKEGCEADLEV